MLSFKRYTLTVRDMTERLQSIQVLRAIAAISVAIAHLHVEFNSLGASGSFPAVPLGGAGIDLFFVISGFIMVHSSAPLFGRKDGPRRFILNRLARIVPLYWLATIIFVSFLLVVQGKTLAEAQMSPAYIAASFLFIPWPRQDGLTQPALSLGWTLNHEMMFYVLFAAMIWAGRRIAVLVVSAALIGLVILSPSTAPWSVWASPIIIEFVFGMGIGLAYARGVTIPLYASGVLVCAAIVGFLVSSGDGNMRFIHWGIPALMIVAGCALTSRAAGTSPALRAMAFLGDCSYSLYLFHVMAFSIPRRLFPALVWIPAQHPIAYAILLISCAICISIVIFIAFERPVTRWLRWEPERQSVDG